MTSLFAYVILCFCIENLKQWQGRHTADDPLLTLMESNEDFLANDNFILKGFTLQMLNILMLLAAGMKLLVVEGPGPNRFKDGLFRWQIPMTCIGLITFVAFIWRGTDYQKFFSRLNFNVLLAEYVIFLSMNVVRFFYNEGDPEQHDVDVEFNGIWSYCFNIFNISFFFGSFVYHFCRKGQKTELEELLDEDIFVERD